VSLPESFPLSGSLSLSLSLARLLSLYFSLSPHPPLLFFLRFHHFYCLSLSNRLFFCSFGVFSLACSFHLAVSLAPLTRSLALYFACVLFTWCVLYSSTKAPLASLWSERFTQTLGTRLNAGSSSSETNVCRRYGYEDMSHFHVNIYLFGDCT